MNVEDIYRPPQADMEAPAPRAAEPAKLAPFFQTSLLKIALLSVVTFGLYQLTWFYRQWDRRRDHGEDVSPLGRTLFIVFFVYGLFKSVNEEIDLRADLEAVQRETSEAPPAPGPRIAHLPAGPLALIFILLNLSVSIGNRIAGAPKVALASTLLTWIPLLVVQKKINELHAALGSDPKEGTAFTAGSIVALVIGGLWWLLILFGWFALSMQR
jgi:Domain of unknown function (DUF4234)